jgi:hypothetical protein
MGMPLPFQHKYLFVIQTNVFFPLFHLFLDGSFGFIFSPVVYPIL